VTLPRGSDGLLHQFTPIVSVLLREDGRYDAEFDWGDAHWDSFESDDQNGLDPEDPRVLAACAAVDKWVTEHPAKIII